MNELDLISTIRATVKEGHSSLKAGIGDDCAIFAANSAEDLVITTDMLVEGVHFDTGWHPPYLLGRKSVAVNISDIAAMGAKPRFALFSIGMSARFDNHWHESFLDGVLSHLKEFDCTLIGGDTVSSEQLTISVTVIGATGSDKSVKRDGARVGDKVFVSGNLGSSAAGLYLFQQKLITDRDTAAWPALINEHLNPQPQVRTGQLLSEYRGVSAMQDISDGIATDLSHICSASKVKATIFEKSLPGHSELYDMCQKQGKNPADFQLKGGEDYQLLFTANRESANNITYDFRNKHGIELYEVGVIEKGEGVYLKSREGDITPISYQGYEHKS